MSDDETLPPKDVADDAPEAATAEPEKKAKKKRKKAERQEAASAALSDPHAVEIAAAFDAGNFVRVRELGAELSKSEDATLAAVGRDYLARIAVDPIQIAFLGICAVALLTIAWIYIPH